ncbi:hypothetical protein BCR36DRAFT_169320, partial [Piromyces finnis]
YVLIVNVLANELHLSKNCADEIKQYSHCIDALEITEFESTEQINGFCSFFNQTICKSFIEDITSTTSSACISNKSKNQNDGIALKKVLEMKLEYLLLCSKDTEGKVCPVSGFYGNNYKTLNENEQEKITSEQHEVILQDCKKEQCNSRMTFVFYLYDQLLKVLSTLNGRKYENDNEPYFLNQLFYSYQNFYKNKECNVNDIVHDPDEDANTQCQEELANYSDCLDGLNLDFKSTEDIENFCLSFNHPKCTKFIEDLNSNTELTCTPKSNILSKYISGIEYVLEVKIDYLLLCSKNNNDTITNTDDDNTNNDSSSNVDGNNNDSDEHRCPVSSYYTTHFTALTETQQNKVSAEQLEMIISDCKIDECNTRMVNLFHVYGVYQNVRSYRTNTSLEYHREPYFIHQLLNNFQKFYKNKKCNVKDIDYDQTISPCDAEILKYKKCIDGVKDYNFQDTKSFNNYCQALNEPTCQEFLKDIYETESACYSIANPNIDDVISGIDYLNVKMNYLLLCAKNKDGNSCPVSNYIINNYEMIYSVEQDSLTSEQQAIIKEDCMDNRCNDVKTTLFTIYENYRKIYKKLFGRLEKKAYFTFIFLTTYANYYQNRLCATSLSEILQQQGGTRSTLCEKEYSKYANCFNDLKMIDFDSVRTIDYLCSYLDQPKCKNFMNDLGQSELACLNITLSNSEFTTTTNDLTTGVTLLGLRIQYQTFCARDSKGKKCPLTQYLLNTYESDDYLDKELDELSAEQLHIIGDDCRDDRCNMRMLSIFEISQRLSSYGLYTSSYPNDTVNSYIYNYKNKTCHAIDHPNNEEIKESNNNNSNSNTVTIGDLSDYGTPSTECQKEYNKYSQCIHQLSSLELNSKEGLTQMCSIFSSSPCKDLKNDLTEIRSSCLESKEDTNIVVDKHYGATLISFKIQYQIYCSKNENGDLCPLSYYMINNYESIKENEEIVSQEQLQMIANDCRDVSCNRRMVNIGEYYDYIQKVFDTTESQDTTIQSYIIYYRNGNCSAIDGSYSSPSDTPNNNINSNTNSTSSSSTTTTTTINQPIGQLGMPIEACLVEVEKYKDCMANYYVEEMNSTEAITAFCSTMDSEICQAFVEDAFQSTSACISIENPNPADIIAGGLAIVARAQYQLYCARDTFGEVCPLSQYLIENYEKVEPRKKIEVQPEPDAIFSDCDDEQCNTRMLTLTKIMETISNLSDNLLALENSTTQVINNIYSNFLNHTLSNIIHHTFSYYQNKECNEAATATTIIINDINNEDKLSSNSFTKIKKSFTIIIVFQIILLSLFLLL